MEESSIETLWSERSSSSGLDSLFRNRPAPPSNKDLLRYSGERESPSDLHQSVKAENVPKQQGKPLFACVVDTKKIVGEAVQPSGKLGLAILQLSKDEFQLFLYRDMKNILWRRKLDRDSEFQILGSCDVMFQESKTPLSSWKVRFPDAESRTKFLTKAVECRLDISSPEFIISQKIRLGSQDQISIAATLILSVCPVGTDRTLTHEKRLNDWPAGKMLFVDEGVGCAYLLASQGEVLQDLGICTRTLAEVSVQDVRMTTPMKVRRSLSDDQPDGKKMRETDLDLTRTASVKDRLSTIGQPSPFLLASSASADFQPRRSDDVRPGSSRQEDVANDEQRRPEDVVNVPLSQDNVMSSHQPLDRSSTVPLLSGSGASRNYIEGDSNPRPPSRTLAREGTSEAFEAGGEFACILSKLDLIMQAVTGSPRPQLELVAGPFDPLIVTSAMNQLVSQNNTLKEEVKEKSRKIEHLSEKIAELALSFKPVSMQPVTDSSSLESRISEQEEINRKLNNELESANDECLRLEEEVEYSRRSLQEKDQQIEGHLSNVQALQRKITTLEAMVRTTEHDLTSRLKGDGELRSKLESEVTEAKKMRDKVVSILLDMKKQHAAELKKINEECSEKIKKIMNNVNKKISRRLIGKQYEAEEIKAVVRDSIRDVTLSLLEGEGSSSGSTGSITTPQKDPLTTPKVSPNKHRKPLEIDIPSTSNGHCLPVVENPKSSSELRVKKIEGTPSFDVPPERRSAGDSADTLSPLVKMGMFQEGGLSHIETPPYLPQPDIVGVGPMTPSPVSPNRKVLERSPRIDDTASDMVLRDDDLDQEFESVHYEPPIESDEGVGTDPQPGGVHHTHSGEKINGGKDHQDSEQGEHASDSNVEPRETSGSDASMDKSAELMEAIQSTISSGANAWTPEPPPPPDFHPDSDGDSDWLAP